MGDVVTEPIEIVDNISIIRYKSVCLYVCGARPNFKLGRNLVSKQRRRNLIPEDENTKYRDRSPGSSVGRALDL